VQPRNLRGSLSGIRRAEQRSNEMRTYYLLVICRDKLNIYNYFMRITIIFEILNIFDVDIMWIYSYFAIQRNLQ